jgi:thioredoxin reductase (NADPH)
LEDAIYIARACKKVYVIHRRDEFRGANVLQEELKALPNVEILYSHVVTTIQGDNKVESVLLKNVKTEEQSTLQLDGVFVAVGIIPTTELLKDLVRMDEKGYVLAGEDGSTNLPGVFVAGDIRKKPLRQIVTAVADGANAATSAEQYCRQNI